MPVVSNPVTSEDNGLKDNYTKKGYFLVQIIATGEKSFDRLNMDCPVLHNPTASEHDASTDHYTESQEAHSVSITVEAPQSIDHQSTDCPVVSNPTASEHDASTDHYTESEEAHSVSITVEAPQSVDQQSVNNQDTTSEYHFNPEENLTDSKSEATISSVYPTAEKCHLVEPCGPQQVTSPYGSLTKDSLIGYKRYTCSYMQAYS